MLTTRWRAGRSFDSLLEAAPSQAERDRIGEALFRLYLGTLFRTGWFLADPHPGSYAFSEDGKVIVYDFGCVRYFERPIVAALAALVQSLRAEDVARVQVAAAQLGFTGKLEGANLQAFLRFARSFFAPVLNRGNTR